MSWILQVTYSYSHSIFGQPSKQTDVLQMSDRRQFLVRMTSWKDVLKTSFCRLPPTSSGRPERTSWNDLHTTLRGPSYNLQGTLPKPTGGLHTTSYNLHMTFYTILNNAQLFTGFSHLALHSSIFVSMSVLGHLRVSWRQTEIHLCYIYLPILSQSHYD